MPSDLPPAPSPLNGQVLFYKTPEALDSRVHGKLGMQSSDRPYSFAKDQHVVPAQVGEFGPASVHYPIIFAGDQRLPLIVMGVNEGKNLFINDDGLFKIGAYQPSFIRRYPFIGARDEGSGRSIVCIDTSFDMFTENNPDVMLFEADGKPSVFTQRCIDFCSRFDQDSQTTISFVNLLTELDLFERRTTTYSPPPRDDAPPPEPTLVAEFWGVSEAKLKALPAAKIAELHTSNALGQIHAHMISLHNWDKLIAETMLRNATLEEAARLGRA